MERNWIYIPSTIWWGDGALGGLGDGEELNRGANDIKVA